MKNIHDFWDREFTEWKKQCILDTYRIEFLQIACFGRFHMDDSLIEALNKEHRLKEKVIKSFLPKSEP